MIILKPWLNNFIGDIIDFCWTILLPTTIIATAVQWFFAFAMLLTKDFDSTKDFWCTLIPYYPLIIAIGKFGNYIVECYQAIG